MFRWAYWNVLLKGKELPIGPNMSLKEVSVYDIYKSDDFITDEQQITKLSGGI